MFDSDGTFRNFVNCHFHHSFGNINTTRFVQNHCSDTRKLSVNLVVLRFSKISYIEFLIRLKTNWTYSHLNSIVRLNPTVNDFTRVKIRNLRDFLKEILDIIFECGQSLYEKQKMRFIECVIHSFVQTI